MPALKNENFNARENEQKTSKWIDERSYNNKFDLSEFLNKIIDAWRKIKTVLSEVFHKDDLRYGDSKNRGDKNNPVLTENVQNTKDNSPVGSWSQIQYVGVVRFLENFFDFVSTAQFPKSEKL